MLRGELEPQKRTPSPCTVQLTPSALSIVASALGATTSAATVAASIPSPRLPADLKSISSI